MRQAIVPATRVRNAIVVMSFLRDGASGLIPPIRMPIELKLEKPHSAYVAMISERICWEIWLKSREYYHVNEGDLLHKCDE